MIALVRFGGLSVLCLGAALIARAQTTWQDGAGNSNWSNTANWSSGLPGSTTVALFNSSTTKTPNLSANTTIGELVFAGGTDAESFTGSRTLTLNGVSGVGLDNQTSLVQTFANKFALGADQTWQSTANGGGLDFNGTINLAGFNLTLMLASSGSSTINLAGIVSGTASDLAIGGNGSVVLSATGSYTGAMVIGSGATLQMSGSGTLSSSTAVTVNAGATYDLNGIGDTISSIAGSGNIALGAATLITGGNGSTTFSGVISDGGAGGSLDKRGTGTLTLSGASTFGGGVILNVGSIDVGHDSALGSGPLDLSGGTLTATANRTLANDFSMSGNSQIAAGPGVNFVFTSDTVAPASNTLTLDNTADDGAHVSVGFSGSGGSFVFDRPIVFDDAATDLRFLNTTGVQTFSGAISGAGNLVRDGVVGTTLLSASNSFTGNIALLAGTLQVSADNRLGTAPGAPTVDKIIFDGGTLNTTSSFTLNSNRGMTLNSGGGTLAPDTGTTLTYGGILAGVGGLTKAGDGTLTLNGSSANSYAGDTVINAGTLVLAKTGGATAVNGNITVGDGSGTDILQLGASNQIADTALITVGSSGVFALNGFTETIGSISGAGLLDLGAGGTGQLTLSSGSATFSGSFGGAGTIIIGVGATLTLGLDFNAPNINFTLAGGTLALNGTTSTFGLLNVTASSVLDFGSATASTLTVNNVTFQNSGLQLSVNSWIGLSDYFYTQNFTSATPDVPGNAPQNQIAFSGFSNNSTIWQSWDNQVTPAPEPATYGAILLGASMALVIWRRRRHA